MHPPSLLWCPTPASQERFHASDRRLSSVLPTMASWFRRLLHKPKPRSVESSLNASRSASSSPSSSSSSAESSGSSPGTSLARSVRSSPVSDINASGSARWAKSYDVCICHSEVDLELVEELVSYLEGQPESFRCFLQLRDAAPGSAVVTELCDAVQNSHCWVMLITPGFLRDPWCKYQMHQALAEAPMANGRTIPVLKDVDRKDYPKELRNVYYIYMALKENSFRQIRDTIARYEWVANGAHPLPPQTSRSCAGAPQAGRSSAGSRQRRPCGRFGAAAAGSGCGHILTDPGQEGEAEPLRPDLGAEDGDVPTRVEGGTAVWSLLCPADATAATTPSVGTGTSSGRSLLLVTQTLSSVVWGGGPGGSSELLVPVSPRGENWSWGGSGPPVS
ncbi:toll/interleukin-1 receptor domain-containing adapter protein isoform 4-T10 [Morphnus guianensis]